MDLIPDLVKKVNPAWSVLRDEITNPNRKLILYIGRDCPRMELQDLTSVMRTLKRTLGEFKVFYKFK